MLYREESPVRNKLLGVFIVMVTLLALAAPVAAGGGQVRGAKGEGQVNQVQVQDPPPFQP